MQKHEFAYICLYYIYILYILYTHTKIPVISVFALKMLKRSSKLIILFRKKILILNMSIAKTIMYNRFTPFPKFIYIFLYTAIHVPGTSTLNIRIFIFSKRKSKKVFENVLKILFGKTDYLIS